MDKKRVCEGGSGLAASPPQFWYGKTWSQFGQWILREGLRLSDVAQFSEQDVDGIAVQFLQSFNMSAMQSAKMKLGLRRELRKTSTVLKDDAPGADAAQATSPAEESSLDAMGLKRIGKIMGSKGKGKGKNKGHSKSASGSGKVSAWGKDKTCKRQRGDWYRGCVKPGTELKPLRRKRTRGREW